MADIVHHKRLSKSFMDQNVIIKAISVKMVVSQSFHVFDSIMQSLVLIQRASLALHCRVCSKYIFRRCAYRLCREIDRYSLQVRSSLLNQTINHAMFKEIVDRHWHWIIIMHRGDFCRDDDDNASHDTPKHVSSGSILNPIWTSSSSLILRSQRNLAKDYAL
jgi:hypothetical protein